jgi:hypothetical protein
MIYNRICNQSNMTAVLSGAGTAYPSRLHEFALVYISGVVLLDRKFSVQYFEDHCFSVIVLSVLRFTDCLYLQSFLTLLGYRNMHIILKFKTRARQFMIRYNIQNTYQLLLRQLIELNTIENNILFSFLYIRST